MALSDFFSVLQNPANISATITENDGTAEIVLCQIIANGYEQLLDTLLARTVDKITFESGGKVKINLAASV